MSLYFGIPILLAAAVLQSTWLERISVLGGRPDLALLLVITWSIIRGAPEGALWGFTAGIFCDLLSGGPFGLWTVVLTVVAFITGQSWVHRLGPTSIRLALMAALGTLVGHGMLLLLMVLLDLPINAGQKPGTLIGTAALLNFVLTPFSFGLLVWFHRRALPSGNIGA